MTTAMTGIPASGARSDASLFSAAKDIGPVARVEGKGPGADDARERAAHVAAVPLLGLPGEVADEIAEPLAPRAGFTEVAEYLAGHDPAAADPVRVARRRPERIAGRGARVQHREVDARADRELEASPEAWIDLEELPHLPLHHRDSPPPEAPEQGEAQLDEAGVVDAPAPRVE